MILLSGGIDSAVLLWQTRTTAVTINYGQPGARYEEDAARAIAKLACVHHEVVTIPGLWHHIRQASDGVVIPARNLMLLAVAAMVAKDGELLLGATLSDEGLFADCRTDFVDDLSRLCQRCYGITVRAPYAGMSKKAVVDLGRTLGAPLHLTYSCYADKASPCGRCLACEQRSEALA
jgi:7-cyano-7-deazaguanine synthase